MIFLCKNGQKHLSTHFKISIEFFFHSGFYTRHKIVLIIQKKDFESQFPVDKQAFITGCMENRKT